MDDYRNTTLSHVYGIAGLIPGLIGLIYLIKTDAPWQDYALLASGWVTALFYGVMLVRCFNQARADGEVIGALRENVKSLQIDLDQKNGLANYLSGLLMNGSGKPRKGKPVKGSANENQDKENS